MKYGSDTFRCRWSSASLARALLPIIAMVFASLAQAAEPVVSFVPRHGALAIRIGDVTVADYVYSDEKVPRPYFVDVKTTSGIQVTRRHPPKKGEDPVDHEGLHTGIWLSFGDLSGCDYWRLKARTEHVRYLEPPAGGAGRGSFVVLNRYRTTDGKGAVCEETCHYKISLVPNGYLIDMSSEFRPGDADLVFGDQEEMGLGVRMATSIAVDRGQGGQILDSAGRRNGKEVWGNTSEWCDYSGRRDDKWVGLTLLSAIDNVRPSWNHARDYGFLAVNPFGRNAFTKQEPSRIVVRQGETFRLRFGVVVHESKDESEYHPSDIYRGFAALKANRGEPRAVRPGVE